MSFFTKAVKWLRGQDIHQEERSSEGILINIAWQAIDLAYKIPGTQKFVTEQEELTEELKGSGWKILCNSSEYQDTMEYGYKATTFINYETKEIVVGIAGTKEGKDLRDNLSIWQQKVLYKLTPAKAMLGHICELLEEQLLDPESYTFHISGHSQGCATGQLMSAEILADGLNLGKCISFENPTSPETVDKAIKAGALSNKCKVSIGELAPHCITFNSALDNCINTLNSPLGVVKKFICEQIGQIDDNLNNPAGWGQKLTNYLYNKVEAVISSFPIGKELIKGIKHLHGHALKNFKELSKAIKLGLECMDADGNYVLSKIDNEIVGKKI